MPRRPTHAERTRADILEVAVRLAAQEGLEGLSVGRLAEAVGMSKAGVFAHFGSKESLQLATVEAAFLQFREEVVLPALAVQAPLDRMRELMDRYFAYLARRLDTGGCFFTAASLEFDDRPGPVQEKIRQLLQARNMLIWTELQQAQEAGTIRGDVEQLAFEVISLGTGTAVQLQLTRDRALLERARAAFVDRLERSLVSAATETARPETPAAQRRRGGRARAARG